MLTPGEIVFAGCLLLTVVVSAWVMGKHSEKVKVYDCTTGYHTWGKWEETEMVRYIFNIRQPSEVGQRRRCTICGIVQLRGSGDNIK